MIVSNHVGLVSRLHGQSAVKWLLAACCGIAISQASRDAWAQGQTVTAKDLIGYAVDEVGPKHEDIDKAIQAFVKRDVDNAKKFLEAARKKDPTLPPTEITLAKLYILSQQGPAARATLEQAVKLYPDDPEPYLIFGEQAVGEGRMTDAALIFEKATIASEEYKENKRRKDNFMIRSYAGLATVAEQKEDWATSMKYLESWLKQDADNSVAHQRLGRALFMLNKYKQAYDEFSKATSLDSTQPHADVIIARLYEQAGDRKQAGKFMDRALANTNNNLKTQLAVVRWLLESEQYSKANSILTDVVKANPESMDAHLFAGIAARITNDQPAALKHLEEAVRLGPQNFDAVNQLAMYLVDQDDDAKRSRALTYADNNVRVHQNNSEAGVALGWVYYKLGRTQEAERVLNEALRVGRLSADSSYFVAQIFYDKGRNDTAQSLLDSALKSNQIFVHRNQAKNLLTKIKKTAGAGGAGGEKKPAGDDVSKAP